MRVALLTSAEERCGIGEYGINIVNAVKDISFDYLFHVLPMDVCNYDIVHVNFEPGLFPTLTTDDVSRWKSQGKKTVLTLHTSHAGDNRTEFTKAFDRVIVHEKTQDGFTYIPHGLFDIDFDESNTSKTNAENIRIGTAGFPFNWKGFHPIAQATQRMNFRLRVIMPESRHVDIEPMKKVILDAKPDAEIITDWLSQKGVISALHDCHVNVFAYEGGNLGISGAVRFGISAKRPLVISKCRQFRDLIEDYPDEVTILEEYSVEGIIAAIGKAIGSKKIPNRIIEDMNWNVVGQKYLQVYKELMN